MLFHRGVWQDPRYLAKKEAALSQDLGNVWAGGRNHKRDLMPKCVIDCVRNWLPNPTGQNYMGHRWS